MFSATRLKDWVLVLYGTERNPQQPVTSTTTTTSTSQPPTTPKKRHRKHNSPPTSPYYRFDNHNISSRLHKNIEAESDRKDEKDIKNTNPIIERKQEKSQGPIQYIYYSQTQKPFRNHAKNDMHMCIFETIAKHNKSFQRHSKMMKKDLSSGKNKSCDHAM